MSRIDVQADDGALSREIVPLGVAAAPINAALTLVVNFIRLLCKCNSARLCSIN
jgi:hypothetical protein